MSDRNRSGIDFELTDDQEDFEVELELDYSVMSQPKQANVHHAAAPKLDPQQMGSRIGLNDVGQADESTVAGPLFILMLVLMVAAMIAAAWWFWTPSDTRVQMNEYIKTQTF